MSELEPSKIHDGDMNLRMIQAAIANKVSIRVIPRRTHAIDGIPIQLEWDTKRLYIETEKQVESILLAEVAHFSFPKRLYREVTEQEVLELERPKGKPFLRFC